VSVSGPESIKKVEPSKVEPYKVEPYKVEPRRVEPNRVEECTRSHPFMTRKILEAALPGVRRHGHFPQM
jgi:hypothetical protein